MARSWVRGHGQMHVRRESTLLIHKTPAIGPFWTTPNAAGGDGSRSPARHPLRSPRPNRGSAAVYSAGELEAPA
jgi:hypothetical protein